MRNTFLPILIIDARLINTSGIGTVCQNIIPFFIKYFKIILLGNVSELKEFEWSVYCEIINIKSGIYTLNEQIELYYNIPKGDFFLSPHYNIPLFPIRAKKRIVIIHDVNHIALRKKYNFFKKGYAWVTIKAAILLSDKVITVSEFSKSEIIKYFNVLSKPIYKINLGVDKSHFRVFTDLEREKSQTMLCLPHKYILYVGNIKPHKNIQALIKAFNIFKQNSLNNEYKLLLVGRKDGFITGDNNIHVLLNQLNLMDEVEFTGYVKFEDLPAIYNNASMLVFPSFYEGFGLPAIEAMSCGCPVIASNISSLPEVCKDAALYFNPLDYKELSDTILKLDIDFGLREKLIKNGLNLVNYYNWEETSIRLQEIIDI